MTDHLDKKISDFFDRLGNRPLPGPFSSDDERAETKQRLLGAILTKAAPDAKVRRIGKPWRAIAAAAAVLVLLGLGAAYLWRIHPQQQPLLVTRISTGIREQKKIMLPDSSVVILNANSSVSFNSDFNKTDRIVTLQQGEAFFTVQNDAARPFRVKADSITTTVLGTSFNMMKYAYTPMVKILVKTGKVSVSSNKNELCRLQPAEQVSVNTVSGQFKTSHAEGLSGDEWTTGRIIIREEPLSVILERLEMLYGVEFDTHAVPDESLRTITFNASMPLQDVLNIVEKISQVRFSKKDHQTKIHVHVK
ncbi:FecR domain-containing protein [Chitinophaga sp. 212800010-3]|uniref:FecR family protein n=1 Tax=unclassified Chitinophaga TaxID=2619133 RepID=UPI002DF23DC4|nr:FecR domain-containing protein [Chitinophaga sp. 212800010-3]